MEETEGGAGAVIDATPPPLHPEHVGTRAREDYALTPIASRLPIQPIPSEIVIPDTIEDVAFILEGVGGLLTATQWGTAAIVYAWTFETGGGRPTKSDEKSPLFTLEAFAGLGIRGLKTRDSVRKYRGAWAKAIGEGDAEEVWPGQIASLPDLPFGPSEGPHVGHNSGDNEWYTPVKFIEAARTTLGDIDLDPASSERANQVVKAARYFSLEDDGLAQEWAGRVWMNPPYAAALIGLFMEKMADSYAAGAVTAAVVLVNNATETAWFQGLAREAAAVCFPAPRVQFWSPDGEIGAPLQGQAAIYLGSDVERFIESFAGFGLIVLVPHG